MKVLVLETEPGAADAAVDRLQTAGHEVVRCHTAGQPAFPCVALADGAHCALDRGAVDVALTVRAHPRPNPAPLEDGAECALRTHVPLVVAGATQLSPFASWATESIEGDTDVVEACERAASAPLARHTEIALEALRGRLEHWGVDASVADATVCRSAGALVVRLTVPEDVPMGAIDVAITRVVAALRAHDSVSVGVDVSVQRSAPAITGD